MSNTNTSRYKHAIGLLVLLNLIHSSTPVILTPPYFNLVANKKVEATATCGEGINEPEFYCKLTGSTATDKEISNYANLVQGQYCYYCDPRNPLTNHHANFSIDGTDKWWQSPPISRSLEYNKVNLTIDLGQEFHVAYIYIKMANSPRPGIWALEKSVDHGKTFTPWQYFADSKSDCFNFFGVLPTNTIEADDQVVCTTEYSKVLPVEGGEILLSLVNNRPNSKNFTHSEVLQQWTRATTVRLRLLRTKNLLGHLMAVAKQDPTVTRRYFYSIRDISIGGRCVCNGHAQMCDESDSSSPNKLVCRCSHNTCGDQCETCCPGFVQKRWRPNKEGQEFKCEPCQCYGHSSECIYDEQVEKSRLSIDIYGRYEGGGVCQNCRDNTEGVNCERCAIGYYRPFGKHVNETETCLKCECDGERSTGNCAQSTGQCECKKEFTGLTCDKCAAGYTGYPNCVPCTCNQIGSENDACFAPCRCKFGYLGPHCDRCIDGYFGFPNCTECGCGEGRSSLNCDAVSGQCLCRQGYTGLKCDECDNGYFSNTYAADSKAKLMCSLCNCNQQGTTEEICTKDLSGLCLCKPNYTGERCDRCAEGFFGPQCEPCNCDPSGSQSQSCSETTGECQCIKGRGGSKCDQCAPSYFNFPSCDSCNCDVSGSIGQSCDPTTGHCKCHPNFTGDKCDQCAPNLFNYPHCEECRCHPDGTSPLFPGCKDLRHKNSIICPCKAHVTGRQCDECKDTYYKLENSNPQGCSMCDCNREGSLNELKICDKTTGQCHCKHHVTLTGCNECKGGSYSLERSNIFGCRPCECQVGSSLDNECDRLSGKCRCLKNIIGDRCDRPAEGFYLPTMHQLKFEVEDGVTKNKKPVRYDFDEQVFKDFSWKGYVHLNKVMGPVTQTINIRKQGTYRMIVNYVNTNPNMIGLVVKVRSVGGDISDEQQAVVYLKPGVLANFETVTINQLSALTLELEDLEYEVSFESQVISGFYLDYFVLLPSEYFEAAVLERRVAQACEDYRNEEMCIEYKYLAVDEYPHVVVAEGESLVNTNIVEIDMIKELNHSMYPRPLLAKKIKQNEPLTKSFTLPDTDEYVLVVDFMNLDPSGGVNLNLDIDDVQTSVATGSVFLYKCNLTTFCREVVLSSPEKGLPLVIKSSDFSRPDLTFVFTTTSGEALLYKFTLIPKNRFHINHIKMAQHCIVSRGQCQALENQPLISTKFALNSPENSHERVHLTRHNPSVTISVNKPREPGYNMAILTYYQPDQPSVNISVDIDGLHKGNLQAAFCPSTSGCRGIALFGESGSDFFETTDQSKQIILSLSGSDSIWIESIEIVAPEDINADQLLATIPLKFTSEFITKCASNHFDVQHGNSPFCDKSVLSMSAKYNNGALKCNCDPQGSQQTLTCNQFGGQCQCKPNIIGRECSRCASGYYGFPECQKCSCVTGSCNEVTGKCDCPINVEEETCKTCLNTYFGFHPKFGCQDCDCVLESTQDNSNECDKETGQCNCKPNTAGRRCEECKAGFYDYPQCLECYCNVNGTLAEICDPQTAECKCKQNVNGRECGQCGDGTFNLQASNPLGCTSCFCFGQTSRCMSADLFKLSLRYFEPKEIEDWSEWTVSGSLKGVEVVNSFEEGGIELEIDEDKVPEGSVLKEPIYFQAPKPFLNNKVTSYGSFIHYTLKIQAPKTPSFEVIKRADLIISSNYSNMVLININYNRIEPDTVLTRNVQLLETNFYHESTGSPVSRKQLMEVLASISSIKLRASYFNHVHPVHLLDFTFDLAVESSVMDADLSSPVLSAERCACPPTYRGYSCESCEYGYYKTPSQGMGKFKCEQCKCNGHANTCNQETGVCIDCDGHTVGDQCQFCKPGYHRVDLSDNTFECRLCPCPGNTEQTVFADSCITGPGPSSNAYYCNCREGYSGNFCQRCAAGYFGNPRAGIACQRCQCNGNINMTDFDSCDQTTGECLRCLYNTTGTNCQECEHWHYGDPIVAKSCKPCECDRCGSETCDPKNGECKCKQSVLGYNCAKCGDNQWGFNQCNGCYECNCDPVGSQSSQCNPNTGQCKCKPGVDGLRCDRCLADHWNFTDKGCTNCQCAKAGVIVTDTGGFSCNSTTGYCSCIPGVKGKQCDECDERWVLVKHQGCRKCDTCVDTLLDDLELLHLKTEGIENGNENSSLLTFKAHNKLTMLEAELKRLKTVSEEKNTATLPILSLQKSINTIRNEVIPDLKASAEYPIVEKVEELKGLLVQTQEFDKKVEELRMEFEALKKLMEQLDAKKGMTTDDEVVLTEELDIYRSIVEQIVAKNFGMSEAYVQQIGELEKMNGTVNGLHDEFKTKMDEIELIRAQNKYVQKSVVELRGFLEKAKSLESFKERDVTFKAFFNSLEQIREENSVLQKNSDANLKTVKELLTSSEETLVESESDLARLEEKTDELRRIYSDHDELFKGLRDKCQLAEVRAADLSSVAERWSGQVASLQSSLVAFEMTQIYENIAANLNGAYDLSLSTLQAYTNQTKSIDQLQQDTNSLKEDSKDLLVNVQGEIDKKKKIDTEIEEMKGVVANLEVRKDVLEGQMKELEDWIEDTSASDSILAGLETELNGQQSELERSRLNAKNLIDKVNTLDSLRNALPMDEANNERVKRSVDYEDETEGVQVDEQETESYLSQIEGTIRRFKESSDQITNEVRKLKENDNFNTELEKIRDEIYALKMLITSTRDIANEIRVAVNFTDTSFINLRPASDLRPSMITTGTFYIQTRKLYQPIAYLYNTSMPGHYMSLNIQNGRPHFQYRLSGKGYTSVSTDGLVNDGEWHRIDIERIGRVAKLTVNNGIKGQETATVVSSDDSVVFNIDPTGAKFILGQYPDSDILPVELQTTALFGQQFLGAIDDVKLNGNSYGLWSYEQAKNIKGEPKRSNSLGEDLSEAETSSDAISFAENSFMCMDYPLSLYQGRPIYATIRFKTHASSGLLWSWWVNEGDQTSPFMALFLESGHINFIYSVGLGQMYYLHEPGTPRDESSYKLNDNELHTVFLKISVQKSNESSAGNFILTFLASESLPGLQSRHIKETSVELENFVSLRGGKQCIGGLPKHKREGIFKSAMFDSFRGCVSQAVIPGQSVNRKALDLQEGLSTNKYHEGVTLGCISEARQCQFLSSNKPVFVKFDVVSYAALGSEESIGISFVTASPNGMLFYRQASKQTSTHGILLQLKDRKLVLSVYEDDSDPIETSTGLMSERSFSDNKLHTVYLVKGVNSIKMRVDNELVVDSVFLSDFDGITNEPVNKNVLIVGGIPASDKKIGEKLVSNFEGCITQIVYNDYELKFTQVLSNSDTGISFSECYKTPSRASDILIPEYKPPKRVQVGLYSQKNAKQSESRPECILSKEYDTTHARPVGLRFGQSDSSRLEVHESFPIRITTHLSFKFRTLSDQGLLFYASDAQFSDFLALWIQEGHVHFAFNLGSGHLYLRTANKYNDGRFHTLTTERDMQSGQLTILDRRNETIVESLKGVSPGLSSSLTVVEPFYFGGIPQDNKVRLPLTQASLIITEPFIGCMSDFFIAHTPIRNRLQKHDIMNCANNHESGTFFTGTTLAAYTSLPKFISLAEAFEISFEFKSRTRNGLVLYIGDKEVSGKDFALLELVEGELRYKLNIGGVENKVKFTPKVINELCASNWVRIKLRKETNGHVSLQLQDTDVSSSFKEDIELVHSGLNSDIYFGALPVRSKYSDVTETNEPFVGCMREVSVMKAKNDYRSNILLSMKLEEGVLNYCPLK